ncbi:hypothetical protein RJT34_20255 [Clitoria ternatea]|uniref:Uncharacterized protein n=1 Tax=Clitoria ternatea TaxID=43366 RepID=A0AAN9P504_CLITE
MKRECAEWKSEKERLNREERERDWSPEREWTNERGREYRWRAEARAHGRGGRRSVAGEQGPVGGANLSCSGRRSLRGGASGLTGRIAVHEEEDLVGGLRKKTGVEGDGPTTGRPTTMTPIFSPFSAVLIFHFWVAIEWVLWLLEKMMLRGEGYFWFFVIGRMWVMKRNRFGIVVVVVFGMLFVEGEGKEEWEVREEGDRWRAASVDGGGILEAGGEGHGQAVWARSGGWRPRGRELSRVWLCSSRKKGLVGMAPCGGGQSRVISVGTGRFCRRGAGSGADLGSRAPKEENQWWWSNGH